MRKLFIRLLIQMLAKNELIVSHKYVSNLRIFKTKKVTFILVNLWASKRLSVYYYYMPEKLYLKYDSLSGGIVHSYKKVYDYIIKEVKKIEEDDIYRKYRISRQSMFSEEIEE